MFYHKLTIVAASVTLFALAGCNSSNDSKQAGPPTDKTLEWTPAMKSAILADFDKGVDSTVFNSVQDGNFIEAYRFRKGRLVQKQYLSRDSLTIYEWFYAGPAGEFELRRKYCPNGQMAYEGITFQGEHCGMDMWWHCNGKVEHQGLRYRSKYFGKWPYYQEDGTLDHEDNFGLMEYLDSLKTIRLPDI